MSASTSFNTSNLIPYLFNSSTHLTKSFSEWLSLSILVITEENERDWVEEEEEDIEYYNLSPDRTDLDLFESDMADNDRHQDEEGEAVENSDQ
ncbi:hypothetical protein PanWU01x14_134060, partial [Parasponia andersonii]